jgi:hypothetical protein
VASIEEVTVTLVDDIDGTQAAETVKFAIDGKSYEIDLSKTNATKMRRALQPYVEHSRGARRTRKSSRRGSAAREAAAKNGKQDFIASDVRAWAKSRRIKVSPRGRIPGEVVERWRASK